jgi:hypothetical protein
MDERQYIENQIYVMNPQERSYRVTPESLAQRWGIGFMAVKETLKVTTQKGIWYSARPSERRFKTKQAQLRYHQMSGRHGRFYTDTMFLSFPTISGRKMAQLYINDQMFTKIYPMKNK